MNYGESNTDKILAESGYKFDSDFGLIKIEVDPTLPPGTAYFKAGLVPLITILYEYKEPDTDLFLGY